MTISIYTQEFSKEPIGTRVEYDINTNKKILVRPMKIYNIEYDYKLLSYPVDSYVDDNYKIIHSLNIP